MYSLTAQAILSAIHRSAPGSWLQTTCVKARDCPPLSSHPAQPPAGYPMSVSPRTRQLRARPKPSNTLTFLLSLSRPRQILGFVMAQKPADRVRWPCFDLLGDAAGLAVALPQEKASAYTAFMWVRLEELPPVPPKQRNVIPLFFAYGQRDRFLGGVRAMVGVTNATGADGRPVALFDVCVQTVAGDMSGQAAPPLVRDWAHDQRHNFKPRARIPRAVMPTDSVCARCCLLGSVCPLSPAEPGPGPDWALPVVLSRCLPLQVPALGLRLGARKQKTATRELSHPGLPPCDTCSCTEGSSACDRQELELTRWFLWIQLLPLQIFVDGKELYTGALPYPAAFADGAPVKARRDLCAAV